LKTNFLTLTHTDRLILDSYKSLIDGLDNYLGKGYEFVLHSLENLNESVIKIVNGHYTGRVEGSPITDYALSMLEQIKHNNDLQSVSYFNKTATGVDIKSTTIPIIGENNRIIGLLCINFYMNMPFSDIIENFIPKARMVPSLAEDFVVENFSNSIDDILLKALDEAKKSVLSNQAISASNKNKEIIALLNSKGIFNMKDSVVKVADLMNISKNTVYMHLRNLTNS